MSNQRPPGGIEGPTQDPERPRRTQGGEPPRREPPAEPPGAEPWADSDRTQAYTPRRRSIVDRLATPEHDPNSDERSTETQLPSPPKPPSPPQAHPQGQQPRRAAGGPPGKARDAGHRALAGRRREGKGLRFAGVLAGVVVLGLVAGGAAAWVSGWRPGFLGTPGESAPAADKPAGDAPQAKPGDPKPGDPKPGDRPKAPPGGEVTRACFTGTTDIKAGSGACGFALDGAGTVTFKGEPIAERLAAGSGPAQRLVLYPFAPSGRYVFLRACDSASGGRCAVQRLADTKEKKLFEVKGGAEGFAWVAWSPKEQVGLLGYREGGTDAIAAIATSDGRTLKTAPLGTGKNRYAVVKQASMRWRNEESFTVEVKLCPFAKGRTRNSECEDDDDVRFRRRTVKVAP